MENKEYAKRDTLIVPLLTKDINLAIKGIKDANKALKEARNDLKIKPNDMWLHEVVNSQTHILGYWTATKFHLEQVISLLKMSHLEINEMILEDKRISDLNSKYMKNMFKELKKRIKKKL